MTGTFSQWQRKMNGGQLFHLLREYTGELPLGLQSYLFHQATATREQSLSLILWHRHRPPLLHRPHRLQNLRPRKRRSSLPPLSQRHHLRPPRHHRLHPHRQFHILPQRRLLPKLALWLPLPKWQPQGVLQLQHTQAHGRLDRIMNRVSRHSS